MFSACLDYLPTFGGDDSRSAGEQEAHSWRIAQCLIVEGEQIYERNRRREENPWPVGLRSRSGGEHGSPALINGIEIGGDLGRREVARRTKRTHWIEGTEGRQSGRAGRNWRIGNPLRPYRGGSRSLTVPGGAHPVTAPQETGQRSSQCRLRLPSSRAHRQRKPSSVQN